MPLITLMTDFGQRDSYVGQLHGAIRSVFPHATIVDLTHEIPPQDIFAASVTLADAVEAFPEETIHVVVVDPGVGSSRLPIAAEFGRWRFVGPNNGLLSAAADRWPVTRAVVLDRPRFWRPQVSTTFHGRDLFGPVAGHWAAGTPIASLGTSLERSKLVVLPLPTVAVDGEWLVGSVVQVDRFGNLITNLTEHEFPELKQVTSIQLAGATIGAVVECYATQSSGQMLALIGSSGRLEVAVANGNAARHLGVGIGAVVRCRRT